MQGRSRRDRELWDAGEVAGHLVPAGSVFAFLAPGRSCGLVALNAVSFGHNDIPMAAGSCLRPGVAGVFAENGGTWQASGPALPAGFGGDQVQVLGLAGGRVETIAGAGGPWRALPRAPAGTVRLAPGTGAGYDALAASGSVLTVWRLASAAWAKVQVIRVPIEYGSSS